MLAAPTPTAVLRSPSVFLFPRGNKQPRINVQPYFVVSTNIDGQNFTTFWCAWECLNGHSVLSPCTSSSPFLFPQLLTAHSPGPAWARVPGGAQQERVGEGLQEGRCLAVGVKMSSHIVHSPGKGRTNPRQGKKGSFWGQKCFGRRGILRIIPSLTPGRMSLFQVSGLRSCCLTSVLN